MIIYVIVQDRGDDSSTVITAKMKKEEAETIVARLNTLLKTISYDIVEVDTTSYDGI